MGSSNYSCFCTTSAWAQCFGPCYSWYECNCRKGHISLGLARLPKPTMSWDPLDQSMQPSTERNQIGHEMQCTLLIKMRAISNHCHIYWGLTMSQTLSHELYIDYLIQSSQWSYDRSPQIPRPWTCTTLRVHDLLGTGLYRSRWVAGEGGVSSAFSAISYHSHPLGLWKLFSMRPVPGAKNIGDYCLMRYILSLTPSRVPVLSCAFGVFPVLYSVCLELTRSSKELQHSYLWGIPWGPHN